MKNLFHPTYILITKLFSILYNFSSRKKKALDERKVKLKERQIQDENYYI